MGFFVQGANGDEMRVIMKTPNSMSNFKSVTSFSYVNSVIDVDVKNKFGNLVVVDVDNEKIREMEKRGYEFVGPDLEVRAFLQDSVDIINTTGVWSKKVSNENLNGSRVSVCVIDSGVDVNHLDIQGKVLAQKCFCSFSEGANSNCCYGNLGESNNASDNNGHGTHVAGIVAASGGINGVAKGANIVAVKVLNSSGSGSSLDIAKAISWCSNDTQINAYNISVISLSLGGGQYSSEASCYDPANIESSINIAVAKNISVVIATGNGDNPVAGIASPACLPNVTRVSAVDKLDAYVNWAYRSNGFPDILLAPGVNVNSTSPTYHVFLNDYGYSNYYMRLNGTSMATPMVAGAIAIINQMLKLTGQSKTPSQVRSILNDTGKQIYDSLSGNNFSRINVYDAVLSIDNIAPNIELVSPVNFSVDANVNWTFVCNATDWQLANLTLKIWNSSGLYYNATSNLSGVVGEVSFNITNMSEGLYFWNCLGVDALGNSGYAFENFSLTIGGLFTTLLLPEDGGYTNVNDTNFSCRVVSDGNYSLSNVTFYLWNSSGNLNYNLTKNISGFNNASVFNYSFVEDGNYSWNCLGVNNASNFSWGNLNYNIVFDTGVPVISSLSKSVSGSGATISWTTNELANSSISGDVSGSLSSYVTSHSIVISGLSPSTNYNYLVSSCDRAGNCANNSDSFTTNAVVRLSGSPGGGGGSSVNVLFLPKIYEVNTNEIGDGYTQKLKKNDKINFSIFDFEGGRHLLSINEVGNDYVELTIESEPINLKLGVGQSVKLNLTSVIYYDLFVKLDAIIGDEAELTIQLINESIELKVIGGNEKIIETKVEVVGNYLWVVLVLVVVLVGIVFVVIKLNKKKLKDLGYKKNKKKLKRLKYKKKNDKKIKT